MTNERLNAFYHLPRHTQIGVVLNFFDQ